MLPNLRVPDTPLLWISNYCCSVATSLFWRALSRIMSKTQSYLRMTVAKFKLLNDATELVLARPRDVLMSELSVAQWIYMTYITSWLAYETCYVYAGLHAYTCARLSTCVCQNLVCHNNSFTWVNTVSIINGKFYYLYIQNLVKFSYLL